MLHSELQKAFSEVGESKSHKKTMNANTNTAKKATPKPILTEWPDASMGSLPGGKS